MVVVGVGVEVMVGVEVAVVVGVVVAVAVVVAVVVGVGVAVRVGVWIKVKGGREMSEKRSSEIQIIRSGFAKYEGSNWVLVPEEELAEIRRLKKEMARAEKVIEAAEGVADAWDMDWISSAYGHLVTALDEYRRIENTR